MRDCANGVDQYLAWFNSCDGRLISCGLVYVSVVFYFV